MSFLEYPKVIPYINVVHFGIFRFWVILRNIFNGRKLHDRRNDANDMYPPQPFF